MACAGGLPEPHQICSAQPMPRSRPSGCGSRSAVAVGPARELGRARHAAVERLDGVRLAALLVDVGVVAAPQLQRVEPELRREHVHRLLQAGRALHHAGRAEGVGRREVDLEREQQPAHVVAVVERHRRRQHRHAAGRTRRSRRARRRRRPRGARRATAPSRTLWRVAARRPPTSCSAWRSLITRTGRRVSRESAVASSASGPGALLAAEAAADVLRAHAHPLALDAEAPAELVAGREHALRRDPGRQLVLLPPGDGAVRLERRLQVARRLQGELDAHVGAGHARRRRRRAGPPPARRGSAARRSPRPWRSRTAAPPTAGRGRAGPAAAAASVSAAIAATGAPTYSTLGRQQRAPAGDELVVGPDGGAHAGHRARGVEVERDEARVGVRRAQHGRPQHPGQLDVDREARRAGRPQPAVLARARRPTTVSCASSSQGGSSSDSSTSVHVSSKRPSNCVCVLTSRGIRRPLAATRSTARSMRA